MSNLAPIVLFVYNRPWHTQQLLNSLSANSESIYSSLYIFCDGAKENDNDEILIRINETREIARNEKRFKEVIIKEQSKNKGLAHSIIDGVTEVVDKHGKVIVLEDDLVLSPYFLYYMNDSLSRYENNIKVGQIGACNFFACGKKYPTTFFVPMPDCWGWATWKNRWTEFNSDANFLLEQLLKKDLIFKFNAYGTYDMIGMLKMQILGQVSSWAIRWQAVCILNNWLILYPNPSFSNHIVSKDATHANINILPPLCDKKPNLEFVDITEIPKVVKAMKIGYSGSGDYFGNLKYSFFSKLMKITLTLIPYWLHTQYRKYRIQNNFKAF